MAVERFLEDLHLLDWHVREHDRGRPFAETVPELCRQHPEYVSEITAWADRYMEMVGGSIPGTVAILAELRQVVRLFALSNWPAETATELQERFPFFSWFEGIVISGQERVAKPEAALFMTLIDRYRLDPAETVFIDDVTENVDAAKRLGFRSVLFESPPQLRTDLVRLGLLPETEKQTQEAQGVGLIDRRSVFIVGVQVTYRPGVLARGGVRRSAVGL